MTEPNIITAFLASLPSTASSLMLRPDGGAKVVFEVPETELERVWEIHRLHGRVFRVVIVDEEGPIRVYDPSMDVDADADSPRGDSAEAQEVGT